MIYYFIDYLEVIYKKEIDFLKNLIERNSLMTEIERVLICQVNIIVIAIINFINLLFNLFSLYVAIECLNFVKTDDIL